MTLRWILVVLALALLPLRGWAMVSVAAATPDAATELAHALPAIPDGADGPPCHTRHTTDGDAAETTAPCERCPVGAAVRDDPPAPRADAPGPWVDVGAERSPADASARLPERPPRAG